MPFEWVWLSLVLHFIVLRGVSPFTAFSVVKRCCGADNTCVAAGPPEWRALGPSGRGSGGDVRGGVCGVCGPQDQPGSQGRHRRRLRVPVRPPHDTVLAQNIEAVGHKCWALEVYLLGI